jgi:hypothetical protein
MKPHIRATLVALIAPLLLFGARANAQDETPANDAKSAKTVKEQHHRLTIKDIARLRGQRVAHEKILEQAQERGVGFEISPAIGGQLRRWGFKPEQIDALRDCYGQPKAEDAEPIVPGQGLRTSEAQREQIEEQIAKITKASGADVRPAQTEHITLWAPRDVRPSYLADIKRLERFLHTKCKEPIRSGLDKRSAHVVLLRSRYEYEKWILAMYDVMGDPYRHLENPAARAAMKASILKWVGYIPPNFGVFCMEGQQADWMHRMVATGIGYMYFTQLTETQKNEPLATGFANRLETVLAGTPSVMLFSNSYHNEDRKLGADPAAWLHLVQQRIAARRVSSPSQLLQTDTTNMLQPQYAEAWTLMDLLAKQPDKFAELVLALREEKDALAAIYRIYGWDEKKLTAQWHKHVLGAR